MLKSQCIHCGQ